jgi:DNA-binding transcriptional MocR family regulator
VSIPSLNPSGEQPQLASVSALAALVGVDKAAVSRRVTRLEAQGLITTQCDGPGKPKLINVAAYLSATAQTGDAIRTANGVAAKAEPPADLTLAQHQARKTAIQADLAQIELDRARGVLVRADDVRDAMAHAAGELVRGLESLAARADELASALARDGVAGLRAAIKDAVRDLRERMAADMTLLATERAGDGDE